MATKSTSGAIAVALGQVRAGVFSNDEELAAGFLLSEGIVHTRSDLRVIAPCTLPASCRYESVDPISRMTRSTDHRIRIAYILLATGAASEFIWSLDINHTSNRISGALFAVAVAIYFAFNRRNPA